MSVTKTIQALNDSLKMANDTFYTMTNLLLQSEANLITAKMENEELKKQLTSKKK